MLGTPRAACRAALADGIPAETILKDGLIAAMAEVGRLFEENEYFVPEMLVAARAMQGGLALLKPYLADAGAAPPARSSSAPSRATCTTSARTWWP